MSVETIVQAAYYDERWLGFQYANAFGLERCIFFLQALRELDLKEPRICDFGCGAGWLSGVLSAFGPTVGVDLSPEAIKRAASWYPRVSFECADGTAWAPESQSFDVVASQEVIEHIEDKRAYLAVIHRALRDDGFLLMTTPNLDVLDAVPAAERKSIWEIQPVELPLNRKQLNALLANSGFKVLRAGSVVTGCGTLGFQRLVNSHKVNRIIAGVGLGRLWQQYLRSAGYGMYLTTVAQKIPSTEAR